MQYIMHAPKRNKKPLEVLKKKSNLVNVIGDTLTMTVKRGKIISFCTNPSSCVRPFEILLMVFRTHCKNKMILHC